MNSVEREYVRLRADWERAQWSNMRRSDLARLHRELMNAEAAVRALETSPDPGDQDAYVRSLDTVARHLDGYRSDLRNRRSR